MKKIRIGNLPQSWLIVMALIIIGASLLYTDNLAKKLALEEQRKMEIWAEATRQLLYDEYSDFTFKIVEENTNIPVIIVDDRDNYISSRNIEAPRHNKDKFFASQIHKFKSNNNPPIEIYIDEYTRQYIYYGNSNLLKQISYFPYIQLSLIALFLVFMLRVIYTDKRNEQNKVWIGLSKETAHQLGTPISSLTAWIEILKAKYSGDTTIGEMDKDVERLKTIAERFSKIGSTPELTAENVATVTQNAMNYMEKRTSKKIIYSFEDKTTRPNALICRPLFEWVIENICKNAIDAMDGSGNIDFEVFNSGDKIEIEITDSGKGIERKHFKTVFKPGYTTKKRGWGLGLSFAKRIVEEYHSGHIYVKSSDIGLGTTFVIELPIA